MQKGRQSAGRIVYTFLLMLVFVVSTTGVAAASVDDLVNQLLTAIDHGNFSLGSGDLNSRQLHAHHVVNIIEGEDGPNFDASKGNPGNGYGAINYAQELAAAGDTVSFSVVSYLEWANEKALLATQTADYDEAGEAIHRALGYLSAALGRPGGEGTMGGALALQSPSDTVKIDIYNFAFGDGEAVTIPVGTTVVWTNQDTAPHTVTGGPLDSGTMQHGETYTFTFDESGVYDYLCVFHPMMTHTIIVE